MRSSCVDGAGSDKLFENHSMKFSLNSLKVIQKKQSAYYVDKTKNVEEGNSKFEIFLEENKIHR